MSDIRQFDCSRCGDKYWERWHFKSDYRTVEADITICQKCRAEDQKAKAEKVKQKIKKLTRDSHTVLQAELKVIRQHLLDSGMTETEYWERVHSEIKGKENNG